VMDKQLKFQLLGKQHGRFAAKKYLTPPVTAYEIARKAILDKQAQTNDEIDAKADASQNAMREELRKRKELRDKEEQAAAAKQAAEEERLRQLPALREKMHKQDQMNKVDPEAERQWYAESVRNEPGYQNLSKEVVDKKFQDIKYDPETFQDKLRQTQQDVLDAGSMSLQQEKMLEAGPHLYNKALPADYKPEYYKMGPWEPNTGASMISRPQVEVLPEDSLTYDQKGFTKPIITQQILDARIKNVQDVRKRNGLPPLTAEQIASPKFRQSLIKPNEYWKDDALSTGLISRQDLDKGSAAQTKAKQDLQKNPAVFESTSPQPTAKDMQSPYKTFDSNVRKQRQLQTLLQSVKEPDYRREIQQEIQKLGKDHLATMKAIAPRGSVLPYRQINWAAVPPTMKDAVASWVIRNKGW